MEDCLSSSPSLLCQWCLYDLVSGSSFPGTSILGWISLPSTLSKDCLFAPRNKFITVFSKRVVRWCLPLSSTRIGSFEFQKICSEEFVWINLDRSIYIRKLKWAQRTNYNLTLQSSFWPTLIVNWLWKRQKKRHALFNYPQLLYFKSHGMPIAE